MPNKAIIFVSSNAGERAAHAASFAASDAPVYSLMLESLLAKGGVAKALNMRAKTIIVDGFPAMLRDLDEIKPLVADELLVALPGGHVVPIKPPQFIFTTAGLSPAVQDALDTTRFEVVRVDSTLRPWREFRGAPRLNTGGKWCLHAPDGRAWASESLGNVLAEVPELDAMRPFIHPTPGELTDVRLAP